MREETRRNLRAGALTIVALAVLAVAIFTIGKRQQLFVHHVPYHTTFNNVMGLQKGAPVNLNGVTVGFVRGIVLPRDPSDSRIRVEFTVRADYAGRIREDTRAFIKTVGLLGDKYLELQGGSAEAQPVPPGGNVTGRDPAQVTRLLSSGEDLMDNLLSISSSLRIILKRVEAGEGLIGQLTRTPEGEKPIGETIRHTVITLDRILARIDRGEGLAGRLLTDDATGRTILEEIRATGAAMRGAAEAIQADLGRDDSAWAAIMRDPEGRRLVHETLESLHTASAALAEAAEELAHGEGTLPRLLRDRNYAGDFLTDLERSIAHLRSILEKVDQGDGTLGAFVNDPQMYIDLENVVRGIKGSKLTTWFIQHNRKKGEQLAREEAERKAGGPPQGVEDLTP